MSQIHLLFPCDISFPRMPDAAYLEEYNAAQAADIPCSLFSVDGLMEGRFRPRENLTKGAKVIYRGWMMDGTGYFALQRAVQNHHATLMTSSRLYQECHHLPGWYFNCRDLTPETLILEMGANIEEALSTVNWDGYFVKDFVKSLTTLRGSVAHNSAEVIEILGMIERFRGEIEGGICIRELEDLLPETEQRYFVYKGTAYSHDGSAIPAIVSEVASRVKSPFYSADIILNRVGQHRLVELGDGQVSDRKQWSADPFIKMLATQ